MLETIYTIGFTKKPLSRFLELLEGAKVDGLLDVRRFPFGQQSGYAKFDTLMTICDLVGIDYDWELRLAPAANLLRAYQQGAIAWEEYAEAYSSYLDTVSSRPEQDLPSTIRRLGYKRLALLCSEDSAERCHRRLAAEWLAKVMGGVSIIHLK